MAAPLANEARDLLLDSTNDLVVTTDLAFVRGVDAVMQECRIALQMFEGEWFLDLDVGIPYWDQILGQKPTVAQQVAMIAFREELEAIDGVIEILRLDIIYNSSNRTMEVTFQVRTALGDTPADSIAVSVGAT